MDNECRHTQALLIRCIIRHHRINLPARPRTLVIKCTVEKSKVNMATQTSPSDRPSVTPERLMQLSFAYAPPLIIGAACANRIFDTLTAGPRTPRGGRKPPSAVA